MSAPAPAPAPVPAPTFINLAIPIGQDAYARAGSQHTLGIWRPAVCEPVKPFARLRYQRDGGDPLEIVVWLPGPHPADAAWWQDLGLWVAVRAL